MQEIADFLGMRRRQAQHWIDTDQIPHFRIGRSICGNRASITAAMLAREAEAMKPTRPRCCPACRPVNRPGALRCKACGGPLGPNAEEQREIDAEFVLVGKAAFSRRLRSMSYDEVIRWADSEEKLRQAANARRYHHGWVRHELSKRHRVTALNNGEVGAEPLRL